MRLLTAHSRLHLYQEGDNIQLLWYYGVRYGAELKGDKEMQDHLSMLVAILENLDFQTNRADDDGLLGDG